MRGPGSPQQKGVGFPFFHGQLFGEIIIHDHGKGGAEFKGGSLHDGFGGFETVFAVLKSTLPSFCLFFKLQHSKATMAVLGVSAVMAVSQARRRHININFFVRLVLGRPRVCPGDFAGFVPGTNPVKTWDKPGFSPYFTQ